MGNLGPTELLIILGIVILMFGAKKLPEFARGMGQSIKEFKAAQAEVTTTDTKA
jgi:sec-independent protein translocase protein TatA